MTLAQLINVLYNIIDRIYIGHLPDVSTQALTGIGLPLPVITIITAFTNLFGMGGAPLFSMARGAGEPARARKILGNSFSMLLICGGILMILCYLSKRPLLYLFGASDITYPYANAYISLYLIGTLFVMISLGMNNFINAQGFGMTGMLTVSIGAVLNLILDPLFIFVLHMGVRGAALATVLSQACSTVYILRFLMSDRAAVRITRQPVNFGWMRRIVQVGLSPALIIALDNVLLISINVMLRKYGGADSDMLIACAAIMQSFMLVITMPLGGITAGTQSILGYNYGACDEKRVMKAFRCIVLLCLVFCGIMFLLAQTVSGAFVKIFTKDPAYIDMAAYMIRTYSLGVLGLTIQYPFVDGMTGMGLVKWGLTFSMLRKGIFLVSVFVLPPIFGATAVMFSEPLSDVVSAVFSGCAAMFLLPKLVAKQCCK